MNYDGGQRSGGHSRGHFAAIAVNSVVVLNGIMFGSQARETLTSRPKPARQQRTLFFEPLEGRHLLAGLVATSISAPTPPVADMPVAPLSYLASNHPAALRAAVLADSSPSSRPSVHQAPAIVDAEGEAATQRPTLIAPLNGTVLESTSVTLKFEPTPGYVGQYYVRLHDLNWDGKQAAGFRHDSKLHYLSITTSNPSITVAVKPGASYNWWVHQPYGEAAGAAFRVQANAPSPAPVVTANTPQLIAPLNGTVVETASVTLKFAPLPGYTGKYYVRLHDMSWDGKQVPGFQHDSTLHYLSIATHDTSITVPVKAGTVYKWWVHQPTGEAAVAGFTVQSNVTPPPPVVSPNVPQLLTPLSGTVLDTASATLSFAPLPGYTGKYLVRLHDLNWDGKQAIGFQHDSNLHYLSIATYDTNITIPVKPGASYKWWVHQPTGEAARASFSVSPDVPAPPAPVTRPTILAPLTGDVVRSDTVTLRFQPLPGYTGLYYVRLHDQNWDGKQASGFQHDSRLHYLSVGTRQTSITLPVKPGAQYSWWVHTPNGQVDSARFTTAANPTLPIPPSADEIVPPELIDGRYVCTSFTAWSGKNIDVSGALQYCIDMTPVGATLEIPAGKYFLNHQIRVDRRITITSAGKSLDDPAATATGGGFAELIASAALNEPGGMLYITDLEALHHVILNGNKSGRQGSPAYNYCATNTNNRYGFNATLLADNVQIVGNTFTNALGGTGLEVRGSRHNVLIRNNDFSSNGVHNQSGLWADGLTLHDVADSRIEGNRFYDNTDIDLILGGALNSVITGNVITHSSDTGGGAFAGLMIHKWPGRAGNYDGTVISHNIIDGGPQRTIGSGIYLGSEGWYDQTPLGTTVPYTTGASVHDNVIRNVQNGMYVAAQGFAVYDNSYVNAHGGTIRTSSGHVSSVAPIVVSPTSRWIDFHGENFHPLTSGMFASANWQGHIPNWPF